METTKIDIIGGTVHCYNENSQEKISYKIDSSADEFLNRFSDNQDLLTINISNPIKRILRFYAITESIPKSVVELIYNDLSDEDKVLVDNFIKMIQSKYNG